MRALRITGTAILLGALISCTEPGETTGMGAVTGGAIGAGLGAIIGSTAGAPGAGLAIGAAGGAATGAVVGNALQAQEETGRTQDEAIERQQQQVAAQRRELEDLKHARDDGTAPLESGAVNGGVANDRSADNSLHGYSYPGSTLRLDSAARARYERNDSSDYQYKPQAVKTAPMVSKTTTLSRRSIVSQPAAELPPPSMPQEKIAVARVEIPAPVAPAKTHSDGVQERDLVAPQNADVVEEKSAPVTDAKEVIPPLPDENAANTVTAARFEAPKAVAPDAAPSAECKQAADEVTKGEGSSEVADKLFHYRRALRLCPDNAQYHLGLGSIYQSLNRKMDAEFEFREALRIDPNIPDAKKNLDTVRY